MVGWGASCTSFTGLVTHADANVESKYQARHNRRGRPTKYKMRETTISKEKPIMKLHKSYTTMTLGNQTPLWKEMEHYVFRYIKTESNGYYYNVLSVEQIIYSNETSNLIEEQHGFESAYKFIGGTSDECHSHITTGIPTVSGPAGIGVYLPFVNLLSTRDQTLDPLLCTNNGLKLLLCSVQGIPVCGSGQKLTRDSALFIDDYLCQGKLLPCLFVRNPQRVKPKFIITLGRNRCQTPPLSKPVLNREGGYEIIDKFHSCYDELQKRTQNASDILKHGRRCEGRLHKIRSDCISRTEYLHSTIERKSNLLIENIKEAALEAKRKVSIMEEDCLTATQSESSKTENLVNNAHTRFTENSDALSYFHNVNQLLDSVNSNCLTEINHAIMEYDTLIKKYPNPQQVFTDPPEHLLTPLKSHELISSPAELIVCNLSSQGLVNKIEDLTCPPVLSNNIMKNEHGRRRKFPSVAAISGCPSFDP